MGAKVQFQANYPNHLPRRVFVIMPVAFAGWMALFRRPARSLPDPSQNGSGSPVRLALFAPGSDTPRISIVRKLVRSDSDWRSELSSDEFAVTRRRATEPPFTGRYWHTRTAGIYRCLCCGNAIFSSGTKFDSGTGWPSFYAPIDSLNIYTKPDRNLAEERTEVLCAKCDAHLGHVFPDGPPPTGQRYCLNSVALSFTEGRPG